MGTIAVARLDCTHLLRRLDLVIAYEKVLTAFIINRVLGAVLIIPKQDAIYLQIFYNYNNNYLK